MKCLGIESTAHTFGIGIADSDGKILSNEWDLFRPKTGWGIAPMEAAGHHENVSRDVLKKNLEKAKITMKDIDLIAVSQGPGLPPCLHKGMNFAKNLAKKHGKPLVGVNHCVAHVEIGKLMTGAEDPVTLYVSGANTQTLAFVSGKYRVFGETQDIGIGNALDKFGRESGLRFPAGPKIENNAKGGTYQELPYTVKGMDLSFSGIITEAGRRVKKGESLQNICFSLQETVFAMLTEVTERAMAHTGKTEVMLTGGVAANRRLQEMLNIMARERKGKFYRCPQEYCGDCGANIAWMGVLAYRSGIKHDPEKIEIKPAQRTDDITVTWL